MTELIKKLMKNGAVAGREAGLAKLIRELCKPYADEIFEDNIGNLYVHKKGTGKKLMLAAHMDEVGFFATFIDDNGRIRVTPVGAPNLIAAAYSRVTFENGTRGILVPDANLDARDLSRAESYYIDIGTTKRSQTEKKVQIGDFAVLESGMTRLYGRRYIGRPFDDRVGCAILISCLKGLNETPNDVYMVFTAQEEVASRGAIPAAFNVRADYALAIDVTSTGDTPGARHMEVELGGGAAIKLRDAGAICDTGVVARLRELAERDGIKHQLEILKGGSTDTGALQRSAGGARAGAISVPTRHIHTGVEMIDMADVEACKALLSAYIKTEL